MPGGGSFWSCIRQIKSTERPGCGHAAPNWAVQRRYDEFEQSCFEEYEFPASDGLGQIKPSKDDKAMRSGQKNGSAYRTPTRDPK